MEAEYKRNIHHNYLVLQGNGQEWESSYQIKMLAENEIKGILPTEIRFLNGSMQYYYEISSKQPFSRLFLKNEISSWQARKFLLQLVMILKEAALYLLEEKHFVLQPDYIYCDSETMEIELLFFPEYEKDLQEGFEELAEYFLQHMDHKEEAGVFFGYQFYKLTKNENFVLEDILKLTQETDEVPETKESQETNKKEIESRYEETVDLFRIEEGSDGKKEPKKNAFIISCIVGISISVILFLCGILIQTVFSYAYTESIVVMGIAAMLIVFTLLRLFFYRKALHVERESETGSEQNIGSEENIEKEQKIEDNPKIWNLEESAISEKEKDCYTGNTVFLGSMGDSERRILKGYIKGKEMEYSLKRLPAIIGKIPWYVDIVIEEESISRMHARFFEKEGELYLEDLNSTNGTKKNGMLLETNEIVKVEVGDEIQLAEYKFIYC